MTVARQASFFASYFLFFFSFFFSVQEIKQSIKVFRKKIAAFNPSHLCRVTLDKEVSSLKARQDDIFLRRKMGLSALTTIKTSS